MDNKHIETQIGKFAQYLNNTRLKSGDPFALQCSDFGVYVGKMLPQRLRGGLYVMDRKFPRIMNKIFAHTVAPHSVALYLQSAQLMYKATGDPMWMEYHLKWANWLEKNANIKYNGYTWGIPFKWLMGTGVLAPKNTPMSTVTPYCSDAFYMMHNYKIALSGAEFILNDLKRVYEDEDKLCLSYSPLDDFMIINVQAYCAAQLYRAYVHTDISRYRIAADKLVNFILSEQNEDGSWYYWSKLAQSPVPSSVDSLHQCYIMQGLYRTYLANNNSDIKHAITRCMNFCCEKLITTRGIVKKFPIHPHANELIDAAEMISTLDLTGDYTLASRLIQSAIDDFSIDDKPYFASWINPRNNIPYIRWGQSQMLYALSQHVALQSGRITVQEIYL